MSLIKLRARVCVPSENQMETEGKYDMGNVARSKEWIAANISILASEVYKIIEYRKNKTLVVMYNDEHILVSESWEGVHKKWEDALVEETIEFEPDEDEQEEPEEEDE